MITDIGWTLGIGLAIYVTVCKVLDWINIALLPGEIVAMIREWRKK